MEEGLFSRRFKKTRRWWLGLRKRPGYLQWITKTEKGGEGEGGGGQYHQSSIFWPIELNDLWSKKICRPKMMFDPVLHSSLDDLVLSVVGDDYEWKRQEIAPENNIDKHNFDCCVQRSIIPCCRGNLIHLRKENGPACQDPINIIVLTLIAIQFINLLRAQQFFFCL